VQVSAVLAGLGGYTPPAVVTNEELAARLGVTDDWIESRTGIRQRHFVADGVATSDLAVEAGLRALKSAGESTVDTVVLATTTPDHPMPATAPAVAARLGLTGVAAYDLNAVCAGFVYALANAAMQIRSGLAERVLVIGADVYSSIVPLDDPVIGPLFGDGAGAVVLRAGEPGEPGSLAAFDLGSDGELAELIMIPGGGSRQRAGGRAADPSAMYFTMQGKRVFTAAVTRMTQSSRVVLAKLGRDTSEVDRIVGHQANARILRAIARQLDVPEDRLVMNIDRVGNTSAASIPLALTDAVREGTLTPGHFTLLTAFGGGLAWGSTALTWPYLETI
jgi:3-oxoacyl-[acyl-carrier-protein] synthase-3